MIIVSDGVISFVDFLVCSETFSVSFSAYTKALEDALAVLDKIAMPVDVNDRKYMSSLLQILQILVWRIYVSSSVFLLLI